MTNDDSARTRFFALAVIRFSGVAVAMIGIAVMTKRWIEPADIIGTVLLATGIFAVMVLPIILVRRWRTPKP